MQGLSEIGWGMCIKKKNIQWNIHPFKCRVVEVYLFYYRLIEL